MLVALVGGLTLFTALSTSIYAQGTAPAPSTPEIDWTQLAVQVAAMLSSLGIVGTAVAKLIVEPMMQRNRQDLMDLLRKEFTQRHEFDRHERDQQRRDDDIDEEFKELRRALASRPRRPS